MTTYPNREQLARAIAALSTASIREKLASGTLTELAREVARDELERRERDGAGVGEGAGGDPPEADAAARPAAVVGPPEGPVVGGLSDAFDSVFPPSLEFLARPFGWPWWLWIALILGGFVFLASFGTHTRNPGDHGFLIGVIVLQAAVLAGILRAAGALFTHTSAFGTLGKLIAVCALGVVLFVLSFCASFARTGWLGG